MPFCVAIDGPAGAGKSTVAKMVAERLNYIYVDTGAMYRVVTLNALQRHINLEDEQALTCLAASTAIELSAGCNKCTRVFMDGKEVSFAIRAPEVSRSVSLVARVPGVRKELVNQQRRMASSSNVVMEGRDVSTVIVPDAQVKIFLTASANERAKRRLEDLAGQGFKMTLGDMIEEINERDKLDSSRSVAPLVAAPDAKVIDSSKMQTRDVVELILELIRRRSG
ncbi:MAG TPA: (d)CMP kinase [Desulfotomaculum sp.]|nr:MAG: Cytidylate kinase [Desulfotomaculum sp. 46_80]HAG09831.1 (d)CMP kinase [Desulfotomaculum sp.]HBY03894.1 (d)CMP kinase [Desulfotomaculum sp.]